MLDTKACVVFATLLFANTWANATQCLFISSYHTGYAWSDGVEHGLRKTLKGECELKTFHMDTKRNMDENYKQAVALKAKRLIESLQPDVVIAADDNASKYLVVPYFKDAPIPFVFCGINWTVDKYGYPFTNATGMIEVAAIDPLFEKATAIDGKIKHAHYIGANSLTERKNQNRFIEAGKKHNIKITSSLVNSADEWIQSYKSAQKSDLLVIGSNAGIPNWEQAKVIQSIKPHSRTLSVTNHGWMMPYTMFGMTKVPEEHGEWAGQVAIEILQGTRPIDIPIIPNRKFNIIINKALLSVAGLKIPEFIRLKAQLYH